jgi:acyl-CoA dehydrogenase
VENDGGWRLDGHKTTVPAAHVADAMLVTARTDGGSDVVFVVEGDAAGVSRLRQDTFNHEPQFHVDFDGVVVDDDAVLGSVALGAEVVDWMVDRATVGLCAVASGVSEVGMRTTAAYSIERHQFERPIATFQAVGQRMADTYIDNEAIRLTMLQAATKLDRGEQADAEVAVAKYWASYGGSRVGHAGLHVHGGISIDLDYSIHRYFLWSKHIELALGAGAQQLAHLGTHLAST